MKLVHVSNHCGTITVDFVADNHTLETWFEVHIGIRSTELNDGFYKVFRFSTYRSAYNKYEFLSKKYEIR